MRRSRTALSAVLAFFVSAPALAADPPPPSGAHPRLFLDSDVLAAIKANASNPDSAAAKVVSGCQDTIDHPEWLQDRGGVDGSTWPGAALTCALAYRITQKDAYLTQATRYWVAALEDDQTLGDKQACVEGASADQAKKTVSHDTGYPIRWYGPFLALTYDWLHDAPGVGDDLLAHTRFCFKAWIDDYSSDGYLHDVAGANYGAGYVAAKAFIAVAEAGEDGATSDGYWTSSLHEIFQKLLIGDGLAGAGTPVGQPAGTLVGGDWPEGWQYGPLSVLEYSLAARAMESNGAPLPEMDAWGNDLVVRYVYAQTPARDAFFSGGDLDSDSTYPSPNGRVLDAVVSGTASDEAKGYAKFLYQAQNIDGGDDVYAALAEAWRGSVTAADYNASDRPLWYLARGTRTVHARSSWKDDAFWAVFSSAPRLVPDHQHMDATTFVLSRGADHLIVDPSVYGERGTLTTNAATVGADSVVGDYKPSQTPWSHAELLWARGATSGVVAARGDYAKAFDFSDTPSDVPFARREWVFLPEGEVVAIDRTRSNSAAEALYLGFHTQAKLSLDGATATGTLGASKLVVHEVASSGGVPSLVDVPADPNTCAKGPFDTCLIGRFPSTAYSLVLPGPRAFAVHVFDALGQAEAAATVGSLNEAPYDASGQNAGVLGAAVFRGSKQSYVVASSGADGNAGATMTYGVPGGSPARHIVFDAPEDGSGKSKVTATASGDRCVITIEAGGDFNGHPLMFQVGASSDGCTVADDPDVSPGSAPPGGGVMETSSGAGGGTSVGSAHGCGCRFGEDGRSPLASALVVLATTALLRRRRRVR